MTPDDVKTWIDSVFEGFRHASDADIDASLPAGISAKGRLGKLYEAYSLAHVLTRLQNDEGLQVRLRSSDGYLTLRSSRGPIDAKYAHFELTDPRGKRSFKVWTDIEFVTLGRHLRNDPILPPGQRPPSSDRHELDIVVVDRDVVGYPRHDQIEIGVECKHVATFDKVIIRAALGVRRELSLLTALRATKFDTWPSSAVPADPPSALLVYSTHPQVADFVKAGEPYGVDFVHLPFTP